MKTGIILSIIFLSICNVMAGPLALVRPSTSKIHAEVVKVNGIIAMLDSYEVAITLDSDDKMLENLRLYNPSGDKSEKSAKNLLNKFVEFQNLVARENHLITLEEYNRSRIGTSKNFKKYLKFDKVFLIE